MFGNPEWFKATKLKWVLAPAGRRGWVYLAAWLAVIAFPIALLRFANLWPESILWLLVSGAGFAFDYSRIVKSKIRQRQLENLHYIDEDAGVVQTPNYDLELKRGS